MAKHKQIKLSDNDIDDIAADILATNRAETITKIDEILKDLFITVEELRRRNPNVLNVHAQITNKMRQIRELVDEI